MLARQILLNVAFVMIVLMIQMTFSNKEKNNNFEVMHIYRNYIHKFEIKKSNN